MDSNVHQENYVISLARVVVLVLVPVRNTFRFNNKNT